MSNGFRAVLVNYSHPDNNHVSALRMKYFAASLAKRGNKIVLLTETQTPQDRAKPVAQIVDELGNHDWSRPFVLACPPVPSRFLRKAREGKIAFGARQAILAYFYLFRSGVFTDWLDGTIPCLPALAETFRPDIVWGTFGNTDAWNISRHLAGLSSCPWVADMKDNWSAFMPTGLARLIARRYQGAAHMTVFSESHATEASRWFDLDKTVIYSGFSGGGTPVAPRKKGPFNILLTGSIYDEKKLSTFIGGLRSWLDAGQNKTIPGRDVCFCYAGNDGARVARYAALLQGRCKITIHNFLPYDELLSLQRQSSLNVYICSHRALFQHKVIELLAAGRPVMSVPQEGHEAKQIAHQVNGTLMPCESEDQVFKALQKINSDTLPVTDPEKMSHYSWRSQAGKLDELFRELIKRKICGNNS